MRETKFRVWDKTRTDISMFYGDHLALKLATDQPDSYVLMQYTGLKDKNGVEIYEGDVVRLNDGAIYTVEYRDEGGEYILVRPNSGIHPLWYIDKTDELDVIGNIYSNPELLKQAAP